MRWGLLTIGAFAAGAAAAFPAGLARGPHTRVLPTTFQVRNSGFYDYSKRADGPATTATRPSQIVTSATYLDDFASFEPGGSMLRVVQCDGSEEWTIHGLWPQSGEYCGPTFYSKESIASQIRPILMKLKSDWPACPENQFSNEALWAHEWNKHGTCTGLHVLEYFQLALVMLHRFRLEHTSVPRGKPARASSGPGASQVKV